MQKNKSEMTSAEKQKLAERYVERLSKDYPEVFYDPIGFFQMVKTFADNYQKRELLPIKKVFEEARKLYPGTKRGIDTEFANFKKKHKDYASVVDQLLPAIKRRMEYKLYCNSHNIFCAEWANFQTWINQRRWEEVLPDYKFKAPVNK